MNKGIIYLMSTIVDGLVKLGKTDISTFEQKTSILEKNGYFNAVGLKKEFAIEVEDIDKKWEILMYFLNDKRISKSELFAIDLRQMILLLSSLKGKQIYPKNDSIKSEIAYEFSTKDTSYSGKENFNYNNCIYTLDSVFASTFKKPKCIYVKEAKCSVDSLVEAYKFFCNYLYKYDSLLVNQLADRNYKSGKFKRPFITKKKGLYLRELPIGNGDFYVEANLSNEEIIKHIRILAGIFKISLNDIRIEFDK